MKSRRDQIAEAKRLGIEVQPVRRTGEMRFLIPGEPPVTINNRRKDGTRAVEAMLTKRRPTTPKEDTPLPVTDRTPPPKPTPEEVARAFIKGRTTEDVLRAMAAEPKADLRLALLVARYDAKRARIAARAAQEGATE